LSAHVIFEMGQTKMGSTGLAKKSVLKFIIEIHLICLE